MAVPGPEALVVIEVVHTKKKKKHVEDKVVVVMNMRNVR